MTDAAAPARPRVPVTAFDGHATSLIERPAAGVASPGVLVFVPAMGVRASFYEPFACALAAAGITTLVPDLRGIGESSVRASRSSDFGFRELVELDLPAAVAATRARHPAGPLLMGGHSLGGIVATLATAVVTPRAEGLALIASGASYDRALGIRKRVGFRASVAVMRALSALVGHFPGARVGFGGREARRLVREWARLQIAERTDFAGSTIDYPTRLAEARTPALSLGFEDDAWWPPRYAERLVELAGGPAELQRLTPAELGVDGPIGHFGWAKRVVEPLAERIARWVAALDGIATR